MAWVCHLGKAGGERGLVQRGWIAGAQFQPGTEPGMVIIGRVAGELDAQMAAAPES